MTGHNEFYEQGDPIYDGLVVKVKLLRMDVMEGGAFLGNAQPHERAFPHLGQNIGKVL